MNAPKLEKGKCSILIAEYATGHVFKKDLTLFRKGDSAGDTYQLFENFYDAENFVLNFIKSKPEFECSIYDHYGEHLKTYDITGKRKFTKNGQE
ncbi:hypothetical protein FAZ19_19105 [Sphingobacterium alkalisoli]|uniref:Uncharacterized protein n=1 Tax=Sphingobacterium alkalisoli TaxID=1874115 RepID=A0A4U0GXM6_9SPHI|nr:hypothetical protein [Sphingobacterium alkalisoli]TJY62582.1 hypothetical protein FAZ19_19105 [Sphingobacterium alkalisoli]GGH27592.1 hypothetical protein GCM10011418_37610 [Sphingobacterium alkalisoli]